MKTRAELEKLAEVPTRSLRNYVDLPKGFIVVEEKAYVTSTAWNPQTGEVRVYNYQETKCYSTSASDSSYNGDYVLSQSYTV